MPVAYRDRLKSSLSDGRWFPALCVVTALVFLLAAIGDALTRAPWWDEGYFANPAFNLAFRGYLGNSLEDTARHSKLQYIEHLDAYTYWTPPLYLVTLAGWFKLFGFSLFITRLLSVLWGLVLVGSWYDIVKSLTGDRHTALLGAAFIASDYSILISCTNGRPDAMTAALGSGALALYLRLRERSLSRAVLAGSSLLAASVLTHPLGLIACAAAGAVALVLDFRNLRPRHAMLAAAPFAAGALAWGLYIVQAPSVFLSQFYGNVGHRVRGMASPFQSVLAEIRQRYLAYYFTLDGLAGAARLKGLVLIGYFGSLVWMMAFPRARRARGVVVLSLAAVVSVLGLAVLDKMKFPHYFVYVFPPLAALTAVCFRWFWTATRVPRSLLVATAAGLMAIQLGGTAARIVADSYSNIYVPVIDFVKERATSGSLVMGPAELAFALPPEIRLIDDVALGFYSGKQADLIVCDEFYPKVNPPRPAAVIADPDRAASRQYTQALLTEKYRLALVKGRFRVYVRR